MSLKKITIKLVGHRDYSTLMIQILPSGKIKYRTYTYHEGYNPMRNDAFDRMLAHCDQASR